MREESATDRSHHICTGQSTRASTACHRRYLSLLGTLVVLLFSSASHATYNTNLYGTVAALMTYASGGLLFALSNQPSTNGTCNAQLFELDPPNYAGSDVVNDAAFSRMYARLAQAYATGESVEIGYDNAGNCGGSGYIRVYRVG
jgi:hypothetical protein